MSLNKKKTSFIQKKRSKKKLKEEEIPPKLNIPEENKIFLWHQANHLPQHADSANSGIHHRDGSCIFIHRRLSASFSINNLYKYSTGEHFLLGISPV